MDTPHVLTGNYGELRPNHFHVGLDFSTNGKINFPVYAVADGYVSRIKVSSVGYGKAVYITHANGKLSLYAHFTSYAGAIAVAVRQEQYTRKNYEVEFFPTQNEIPVKKGELIGYSGNSGNSSGPHLHFEIRDEKTEVPLNPLEFYKIRDTIAPRVSHLAFYNLSDTSSAALIKILKVERNKRDSLFLRRDSVVLYHSILGFAFSGYDQFVAGGNANVPYSASLYLDENLIYTHTLRYIPFPDQRYVNEFSETINKVKYQRCFLPGVYPEGIYNNCVDKGRIVLNDTVFHTLKLMLRDEQGNGRELQFYIKARKQDHYQPAAIQGDLRVLCNQDASFSKNGLRIYIPARTLYHTTTLAIQNSIETKGQFTILPSGANLAATISIGFRVPARLAEYKEQLVLRNHAAVYIPVCRGDSAFCSVYNLGSFELRADTLGPNVRTQFTPKKIKRLKNITSFSFVLTDNLSGIGQYSLFVNDNWVPAEFDAKNKLLTYIFDETTPSGPLTFSVDAVDRAGNTTLMQYTLKR